MKRKTFILPLIALLMSSCEIKSSKHSGISGISSGISDATSNESTSLDEANSSNNENSKVIRLEYSGKGSDKEFNLELFEQFKAIRRAAGDPNTYEITYVEHGPDSVDSEVLDWEVGPDVYEFASDKITSLYEKGALAKIVGNNATFIEENNSDLSKDSAIINGSYYAYPYALDTSYYVQYDKSFFTAEDVKSIETMLDKAQKAGKKVGYNLKEAFWGGGAMFTFGADYQMTFDEYGAIANVTADFNTDKGLKAAKAIQKIVNHPAWTNNMDAPTPTNNLVACIAGTWDIAKYKAKLGDNYGVAVMPTVTIDGDTKHLGSFLNCKLLGVNSQRAGEDIDRIVAAHELAKFLSGKETQLKRFNENDVVPCNIEASKDVRVVSDPNAKVLIEQAEFAHAQTIVPNNFWTASLTLVGSLIDGTIATDQDLIVALEVFNTNIKV